MKDSYDAHTPLMLVNAQAPHVHGIAHSNSYELPSGNRRRSRRVSCNCVGGHDPANHAHHPVIEARRVSRTVPLKKEKKMKTAPPPSPRPPHSPPSPPPSSSSEEDNSKEEEEEAEAAPPPREECPYTRCTELLRPGEEMEHHKQSCVYRPVATVTCVWARNGCTADDVTAPTRAAHEKACPFRKVACQYRRRGCGVTLLLRDVATHETQLCAHRPVPCKYDECIYEAEGNQIAMHESVCNYKRFM